MDNGLIRFKDKLWVAQNSALQTKIIHAFHASAIGGHSGMHATYQRIHRLFHWTGLKMAVEDFVKQCQVCQQTKHLHTHPAGLLQPLPIPWAGRKSGAGQARFGLCHAGSWAGFRTLVGLGLGWVGSGIGSG